MLSYLSKLTAVTILSLLVAIYSTPSLAQDIYDRSPINPDLPPTSFNQDLQDRPINNVTYPASYSIGSLLKYWWVVPLALVSVLGLLLYKWAKDDAYFNDRKYAYSRINYQQIRRGRKKRPKIGKASREKLS